MQTTSALWTLWVKEKEADVFAVLQTKSVVSIQGDFQHVQTSVLKIMLQKQVSFYLILQPLFPVIFEISQATKLTFI